MRRQTEYWTNPSVVAFAGTFDPIDLIVEKTRSIVLSAIEGGWQGPPFDPFKLAEHLKVSTIPMEDLFDARTVPEGSQRFRIEYNPNKPSARIRFSIAHELAHTLFDDCRDTIRNRGHFKKGRDDEWQLELLCNIAAAELLMPVGSGINLDKETVSIDNILNLQKKFGVSTETISRRLVNLTAEPCTFFTATRLTQEEDSGYRVDYSIASRSSDFNVPSGYAIPRETVLSECAAIGYTAEGAEKWGSAFLDIECVGIPTYPHHTWPRIAGIVRGKTKGEPGGLRIIHLMGDALAPRGRDNRIIAHIVNDRTPNWGAGFALEVKKKWPSVQQEFKEWIAFDQSRLALGEIYLSPAPDSISVVHMIAQHGYGASKKPRIRYKALKTCLEKLGNMALKKRASVHIPRIGTGQAGGNWWVIEDLIDVALVRRGIDVTVYDLPGSDPLASEQIPLNLLSPNI